MSENDASFDLEKLKKDLSNTFWGSLEAFNPDTVLERDDIAERMESWLALHGANMALLFGRRKDLSENPIAVLRWMLAQIGLQLESRKIQENGTRRRVYFLSGDTAAKVLPKPRKAKVLPKFNETPAPGFVYLVQSTTGHYKIGRTENPIQRISKLDVMLPFDIDVLALIQTQDMCRLEKALHVCFADKRVRGEWFNLSADDAQYIASLAKGNE